MGAAARTIEKSAEAYRSIGEAAKELGLPTHVLRYWETKFPRHVKPVKRPDGRRMFRPQDLDGLRAIQILVHERGMTLKGAKSLLLEQSVEAVLAGDARLVPAEAAGARPAVHDMQDKVAEAFGAKRNASGADACRLAAVLTDLVDLKARLDAVREKKAA